MEETSCKCDGSMGTLRAYTVRGARMPESKKSPSFWVSWASGALAHWAKAFYADVHPSPEEVAKHVTDAVRPALQRLSDKLAALSEWSTPAISEAIKAVLTEQGLKMPQLAMPVRVLVMGTPQTPSLDAVLALCGRDKVLARINGA